MQFCIVFFCNQFAIWLLLLLLFCKYVLFVFFILNYGSLTLLHIVIAHSGALQKVIHLFSKLLVLPPSTFNYISSLYRYVSEQKVMFVSYSKKGLNVLHVYIIFLIYIYELEMLLDLTENIINHINAFFKQVLPKTIKAHFAYFVSFSKWLAVCLHRSWLSVDPRQ